jgi:hypothetical protein
MTLAEPERPANAPLGPYSTVLNETRRASYCLSMIFSENRFPLFGIMLCKDQAADARPG